MHSLSASELKIRPAGTPFLFLVREHFGIGVGLFRPTDAPKMLQKCSDHDGPPELLHTNCILQLIASRELSSCKLPLPLQQLIYSFFQTKISRKTPDLPPQSSAIRVSACLSPLQCPPGPSTSPSPKYPPQSGSRCTTCRQTETCVGRHRNLECSA